MSTTTLRQKAFDAFSLVLMICLGLGIGYGANYAWSWYQQEPASFTIDSSAHYQNVDQKVIVYTTQWCPYCKQTKAFLAENSVPFLERDIELGDAHIDQLYASLDSKGIPKVIIGDTVINGYNVKLLRQHLEQQQLLQ